MLCSNVSETLYQSIEESVNEIEANSDDKLSAA